MQDEIAQNVAASIEPHRYAEEGFRAASRPPESIDVWGLAVRSIDLMNRLNRRDNEEAQRMLHRAIPIDPHYARAHATCMRSIRSMTRWRAAAPLSARKLALLVSP